MATPRQPFTFGRRSLLAALGAGAGSLLATQLPYASVRGQMRTIGYPFTLGVASGDPLPDGVVLWTRLAPNPLVEDGSGGIGGDSVPVQWQVATDEGMRNVVQSGTVIATPQFAYSVHVEVSGLLPARVYHYRFTAVGAESPVGRTKTAPALGDRPDRLRFAFASCQHYEQGLYTAYQRMAGEDLDLVAFLGDYIYEGGVTPGNAPRKHNGPEIISLADYRNRYAQYKLDPHLQAAHAAFPWIVTPDDHEVENNYANDVPQDPAEMSAFLTRRAAAYQAYWEHLPLRASSLPMGPNAQFYRRLIFGDLADFSILDTRQYRSDQPCGDGIKPLCTEALDPNGTMTGPQQESWLLYNLASSRARWNVIAQQTIMASLQTRNAGGMNVYGLDSWGGYPAARTRILSTLDAIGTANAVVITGDIHANFAADLKLNFDDPNSRTVGVEFVGTSISSGGTGSDANPVFENARNQNPWVRYHNNRRGYVRCDLSRDVWRADYRTVAFVNQPDAPAITAASWAVERGQPGLKPA